MLGDEIRRHRQGAGITLQQLARETSIDVSQLSRFERGRFKFVSENLQKVLNYLQITETPMEPQFDLVQRFSALVARSSRHQAAARALILALEALK